MEWFWHLEDCVRRDREILVAMCMLTLGVLNDSWGLALHHSDGGVCGSQVNTDDLTLDLLVGIAPSK